VTRKFVKLRHEQPKLPYAMNALEPFISRKTVEYHYGEHHRGYVSKLNSLVLGTWLENAPLAKVVEESSGALFENAAQVWNHNFYWQCMAPDGGGSPRGDLYRQITHAFGSFDGFRRLFSRTATEKFGAGWAWLVRTPEGSLEIQKTDNADNPLRRGDHALLACDIWEHAYYLDYQYDRSRYVDAFWNVVNWRFVEKNFLRQMPVLRQENQSHGSVHTGRPFWKSSLSRILPS